VAGFFAGLDALWLVPTDGRDFVGRRRRGVEAVFEPFGGKAAGEFDADDALSEA
jgi:hypothetical protein